MSGSESRLPGFYRLPLGDRRAVIADRLGQPASSLDAVLDSGGLAAEVADKTVENALGTYALPFGLGLNFRINDRDRLVAMVVEEPSVIAAASNAARMARAAGGFTATLLDTSMTAQVELREIADMRRAAEAIHADKGRLLQLADASVPSLVKRGGGARGMEFRVLSEQIAAVHIYIDCQDAMGANLVNTVAESIGPELARLAGAKLGLRILTNLCDHRRVRAGCRIAFAELCQTKGQAGSDPAQEGQVVAEAIAAASRFAELDPYRAATHNKGVMNGIDSVVIATGNDYRAVEAGAHAWAAHNGRYEPLATWHVTDGHLHGQLEMPLALGVVGGTIRVHPTARLALRIMEIESASELIQVAACVGLASNLAALKALSTEGIQRGHMSLHARSLAMAAGATPQEVDAVVQQLLDAKSINETAAREILHRLRAQRG